MSAGNFSQQRHLCGQVPRRHVWPQGAQRLCLVLFPRHLWTDAGEHLPGYRASTAESPWPSCVLCQIFRFSLAGTQASTTTGWSRVSTQASPTLSSLRWHPQRTEPHWIHTQCFQGLFASPHSTDGLTGCRCGTFRPETEQPPGPSRSTFRHGRSSLYAPERPCRKFRTTAETAAPTTKTTPEWWTNPLTSRGWLCRPARTLCLVVSP